MRSGVAGGQRSWRDRRMIDVTLMREAVSFSKRGIAGPIFAWDPQAECGFLREDLCEVPIVFSLSVAALILNARPRRVGQTHRTR